jgi:hypothetical protein
MILRMRISVNTASSADESILVKVIFAPSAKTDIPMMKKENKYVYMGTAR